MKLLIKSLLFAATLAVSAQSFAAYSTPLVPNYLENGWFGESFVVRLPGNAVATGCSAGNDVFLIEATNPSFKTIVNLATVSYMAKRKISFVFDTGVCDGLGRTKVVAVQVHD